MSGAELSPWRVTEQEQQRAMSAVMHAASTFLGPYGPLVVWGLEYLYNRRNLIFDQFGAPIRAYSSEGSALRLSTLIERVAPQHGTLSLNTALTKSARDLGLRNGDPVSIILTGHTFVQGRSRLVVPTRVGERIDVAAPYGSYSLAAFGSRTESLFTMPDPYSTVAGKSVLLGGRHQLQLPLTARGPVQTPRRVAVPNLAGTVAGNNVLLDRRLQLGPPLTAGWSRPETSGPGAVSSVCVSCGQTLAKNTLAHLLCYPRRPAVFPCDQCSMTFSTQADLDGHKRIHWKSCSYCGLSGSGLGWHAYDCPVGQVAAAWDKVKRFFDDL